VLRFSALPIAVFAVFAVPPRKFTASDIRFAVEILACGQLGLAKSSGALRCSSLFLILIEIAWRFADLRTPPNSLATAAHGLCGPLLFLQKIYRH
jgi:hypothetical protein